MRALIVDDSSAIRSILRQMLKSIGFVEVLEAKDGQKALEMLKSNGKTNLALVDWNMPGLNGFDLLCEIRKDHSMDEMRIIMVTTETEMSQVAKALEAGANEYIMKPFTKEVLQEKLDLLGIAK